jgi:hypothetical protein
MLPTGGCHATVRRLRLPTKPKGFSDGLGLAIRALGALFVSASCGIFCIRGTEDIDSKRATLQVTDLAPHFDNPQGAATFSLLAGLLTYFSKQLWDPLTWRVTLSVSAIGFIVQSYYGCLVSSSRP